MVLFANRLICNQEENLVITSNKAFIKPNCHCLKLGNCAESINKISKTA